MREETWEPGQDVGSRVNGCGREGRKEEQGGRRDPK